MSHKHSPGAAKREARLLEELEAERRENQRLRQTISVLRQQLGEHDEAELIPASSKPKKPRNQQERWSQLLMDEGSNARSFSKKSYPRYLIGVINASTLGRTIRKITLFFRRVRLVRMIVTITTAVATAILLLPVYVIVLPIVLTLTVLTAFFSLFFSFRKNKQLREALADKHIYVFVAADDACLDPASFFARSIHQLAQSPDRAVLVVSPHNLRTQGLGGRGAYLTARRECQNVYIVRRHYFFNLRRRVLRLIDERMTIVY